MSVTKKGYLILLSAAIAAAIAVVFLFAVVSDFAQFAYGLLFK